MKIAIIGAGSIIFCTTLIQDVLATPGLGPIEFALMSPTTTRTTQVEAYVNAMIKKFSCNASVYKTTDRRDALRGASYVVSAYQIGGVQAFGMDYNIPMSYGVDNCIADSMGPGGIFRALRSIPVMNDLAQDMKELCPNALLLNYVNPMAMMCWALGETGVNFVGLCHGVQTTLDLIAGYCAVPKAEIDFTVAGINHMSWFLKIEHEGQDLYPLLRERFEQPEYYINEKVRGEVFRQFGYFMTESTGHLSEYLPWFRSSKAALDLYCDEPAFGGESGAYYKYCKYVADKYKNDMQLDINNLTSLTRSVEYCSYIIEAIETGKTFKFYGNVKNESMIENLPHDCCAEGAIYADKTGLHKTIVGKLPRQCAALNMTNINVQGLVVEAANTGNIDMIVQACALDPLTGAVLTLPQIREMVAEMLSAQAEWLPQFSGKKIHQTPTIVIPPACVRADVPVDPALAIMAKFGELGK